MRTGPICRLCGSVVPTVSWATLVLDESPGDEPAAKEEALAPGADPAAPGPGRPPPGARRPQEVGLCPDCLARAKAEGRLLAPVIPIDSGRRGRKRRAAE